MDIKISFHLNEQMVNGLREELKERKATIETCVSDDNPEAKRVLENINDLLLKLDNGGEFVCDNKGLKDEEDVEDFTDELAYLIECGIGIV